MTGKNHMPIFLAGILLITCIVVPATAWQEQIFSPYVDTGLYPKQNLSAVAYQTGVKYFTLAFITSGNAGAPMWAGAIPLSDRHYQAEAESIRSMGGDVIISFGGASGTELAQAESNELALQGKYQSVIDTYKATWIDFDIEGSSIADTASVDRRNAVIARLEAANPGLRVSYTLPAEPDGLTTYGKAVLQSAVNHGARIDVVNIMTMDFGSYYAPEPTGKMGEYAIECAESLKEQLQTLYPAKSQTQIYAIIGITPMIGQNDVQREIFTLADAEKVTAYAQEHGIGMLSMWSLARDNGSGAGATWASPTASGLSQADYAFSSIFNSRSGQYPVITPTPVVTSPVDTATPTPAPVITTETSGVPNAWSIGVTYTSGSQVSYLGERYTAQWWTRGDTPGKSAVWKRIVSENSAPVVWDSSAVYTHGDIVLYKGIEYQAQWWTSGEIPGSTAVWTATSSEISPVLTPAVTTAAPTTLPTTVPAVTITTMPSEGSSGNIIVWNATQTYNGGSHVIYLGERYTAQWWTYGDTPGKSAVWKRIVSENSAPVVWDSSAVYTTGDIVLYKGIEYRAQWWTSGEIPGSAAVWTAT